MGRLLVSLYQCLPRPTKAYPTIPNIRFLITSDRSRIYLSLVRISSLTSEGKSRGYVAIMVSRWCRWK